MFQIIFWQSRVSEITQVWAYWGIQAPDCAFDLLVPYLGHFW